MWLLCDLFALCTRISITMTSQWAWWRLRSPASRLFTQPFIQTQIKENIKAPRHWPLCGEFTGTGEFPAQRASYAEYVSIWWGHHAQIRFPGTRFPRWLLSNPEWYAYTVDYRYNAVQFITISLSALRWQQPNANQTLVTTGTPYLAFTGELCGVYCEDLGENYPCYKLRLL